jgi:phosphoribosylanthranilate isomerase
VSELKFCGLTREEDAALAAALGARYLGVIFAGGPRALDPSRAAAVLDAGATASAPGRVGVFARQGASEIASTAAAARLDVVQLHADPNPDDVRAVRARFGGLVWAVIRTASTELPEDAEGLFREADAVVLDARSAGGLGGTGIPLDWAALAPAVARVRGGTPLVLAGGLTDANLGQAIRALQPDVVDVSSGVERAPGIKDPARMRAFAAAARAGAQDVVPTVH